MERVEKRTGTEIRTILKFKGIKMMKNTHRSKFKLREKKI